MAEKVEEIAELLETLKKSNETNAEDFNNLLVDIRLKLENLNTDNVEFASVVSDLSKTLSAKLSEDEEKLITLGERLTQLEILFGEKSSDNGYANLKDQMELLSSNFREAVESVVNFANKDSESKNVLFDKVTALEDAVKNNETSEVVKQKFSELSAGYEHFVADSNLRHGNIISAMADLRQVIEESSAKNSYMIEALNGTIISSSEKLSSLDSTVSSQFGTVNSKLFSMGDDIQKTLNDGFEHLKYLSSNLSENMNSSSIDMKTTLECLRANLSDYSEQLRAGLDGFNNDFGQKIADSSNIQTTNAQSIITTINTLENNINEKAREYDNLLNDNMSKICEFLTVYRDAILTVNNENKEAIAAKLSEFEEGLNRYSAEYKEIAESIRPKFDEASSLITETADSIVLGVVNSNNEIINELRTDLVASANNNLETIINRINETSQNIDAFKTTVADNLSQYLSSIKDLFVEYSNRFDLSEQNEELVGKFNRLEELISKSDENRNVNFDFVRNKLESSGETLQAISDAVNAGRWEFSNGLQELKNLIADNSNLTKAVERFENAIESTGMDNSGKFNELRSVLDEYKQSVEKFSDDMKIQNGNALGEISELKSYTQEILPKLEPLSNIENIINGKAGEYRDMLHYELSGVREAVSEVKNAVGDLPVQDNSELVTKLTEFETQLNDNSAFYEQNMEALKVALGDYVVEVSKMQAETGIKFDAAFGGIKKIQDDFDTVSAKMSTLIGDSGLIEILANIRQQFNVVLSQIRNEKEELVNAMNESLNSSISDAVGSNLEDVNKSLNEGIASISSNLYLIGQNIEEVRCKQSENAEYLRGNFEEKMLGLQADIEHTITDIKSIVDMKSGVILDVINQLKEAADKFIDFNYPQVLSDIKNQIEISYVKVFDEVKALNESGVTFEKIENLYKDAVHKLTSFEEYVRELSESNFDLINQALLNISTMAQSNYTIAENIQSVLENDFAKIENNILENRSLIKNSLVEQLEEIKNVINEKKNFEVEDFRTAILPLLDNDETMDLIKSLNKNLAERMEVFKQEHTLAAQDILDVVNGVNNTVDYTLDVINEKFENNSNLTEELNRKADVINLKLDVLAMQDDTIVTDSIDELNESVSGLRDVVSNINHVLSEINENTTSNGSIIPAIKMSVEKLKETISDATSELKTGEEYEKALKEINLKLDILSSDGNKDLTAQILEIRNLLNSTNHNVENIAGISDVLKLVDNKLDIIAADDNSEILEEIQSIKDSLNVIRSGVEVNNQLEELIRAIDNKLSVIAQDSNNEIIANLELLKDQIRLIQSEVKTVEGSSNKLEDLVNALHAKVDVLADSDDNDVQEEISEIRSLIEEQIESGNSNDASVNESLQKLLTQISEIDLSKQAGEIKESVISAVVAVTNEISFVEETEEIKDFVNERTNELHRTMMDVKNQLSTLTCTGDDMDFYSYTLQDVESDIAKLRLILKDMSGASSSNEICVMSNNILKISKTLEDLKNAFVNAEARRIQGSELNEQVVSISSRLNQLLLNKKEVDDIVLASLEETKENLYRIDNTNLTREIEKILLSMDEKLAYSTNLNTILKNVMMYLGEWMDGTTETISSIYDKASKVSTVSAEIEELRNALPDNQKLVDVIEAKFNEQDAKILRLEEQLDRISGMLNSRDYSETLSRIDKLDEKLERLGGNIEKLASYVE